MLDTINLPLILLAAFIGAGSPGPSTLAIAGTSMANGRRFGVALAAGIVTGSFFWSISAAAGLAVVMKAHVWMFETMRYAGAGYLLWLAWKSARSALNPSTAQVKPAGASSLRRAYIKGLMLHLTNPKAILFFASLYSIGVPRDATPQGLMLVIAAVGLQSIVIFQGYALLFSNRHIVAGYTRLRRWFDAAFALAFGAAGVKILTARLT